MDFLKNLTNDDRLDQPPARVPGDRRGREGADDNLLERFANKLNLSETSESVPPPRAPEHKSLLDKLGDTVDDFNGKKASPPPLREPTNILEKIGDVLKGEKSPPPPPPKPEGLLDKISDVLQGGRQDEPRKPQTLGEKLEGKLNNALGGGARGEAKEDHLDKAIDFVQEHILKEGQQRNESAIEQVKDEQIAGAIRSGFKSLTGRDLPSSKA